MILRLLIILICTLVLASAAMAQTSPEKMHNQQSNSSTIAGRLVVKLTRQAFARGVSVATFGDAAARYGITTVTPWLNPGLVQNDLPRYKVPQLGAISAEPSGVALQRIMVIRYTSPDAPEAVAHAISRIAGVEYAEPVYRRRLLFSPNDPEISRLWYLDVMKVREAWDVVRADSSIIIAITDTGIEKEHEDLSDAIWKNWGEHGTDSEGGDKRSNGKDDDGNGLVDDWWGYDFAGEDGNSPDNDPSSACEWHGTHVAGIAAASGNNGKGVIGIAFGARLMAVKISDDACVDPDVSAGFEGILYAAKMGAKIINCSWGGRGHSRAESEVIASVKRDYGVLIIAAAGNNEGETKFYPAAYDGVISVAAVDAGDTRASYSNYYYQVDLSAPGSQVYSTRTFGDYEYILPGGTSMAAPMVSGTAALLMKKYPGITAAEVEETILASTDDISTPLGPTYASKMGAGRLNVLRAVTEGRGMSSARMTGYRVIDENGDGMLDPGEKIQIRTDIKNILAPASEVTVLMESVSHPAITIDNSLIELGAMTAGEVRTSPDNAFHFTVPTNVQPNDILVLGVSVQTPSRLNTNYLEIPVAPTWMTTDYNTIASTFNSLGNIAYNGLNKNEGEGFTLGTSKSLLYHGGLMIGIASTNVADVVRVGALSEGVSDGFRMTKPYRLRISDDSTVQIGTARFNDSHLNDLVKVGADVEMTTYEYRDQSLEKSVTVVYRIHNTTDHPLSNLHCALYLDWDISTNGGTDRVDYVESHQLGYTRDAVGDQQLYSGATLLSQQPVDFYAINNDDINDGVTHDFTIDKKWRFMSNGVARAQSQIGDVSMVIGGGPITIAPGESADVAFALLAANDLDSLKKSARNARDRYLGTLAVPVAASGNPLHMHITPNPFSDEARISFTMPHAGHAMLAVYDFEGNRVATLVDGPLTAGDHAVTFAPDALSQGMYVYELKTAEGVVRGKVVRMAK
jgi:subtilisin family serine protease